MTIKRNYYRNLLEDQFDEIVKNSDGGYYLVAFNNADYALNEIYDDILEEVAQQFKNKIQFYRIDSSTAGTLISKMGINNIPIVYIYTRGEVVKTFVGIYAKAYLVKTLQQIIG